MVSKDTIMKKAIDDCLEEMFQKSQPKASYFDYVEKVKRGEISKEEKVFEHHYLNKTQFDYIANKYKKAYRLERTWIPNIDFLLDCLKQGGFKTVYKPLIEGGEPVRNAEKTPSLDLVIGKENAQKVFNLIEDIRDFYKFDKDEAQFDFNVYLGCSPTSNAETVKEYWKSQGIDIEIDTTELSEDDYWELDNFGHLLNEEEE